MTRLLQDLRYSLRQLAHTRGFTAIAIVTLALGIGGSTVFFAAVNAMVLRPLRSVDADGLFVVQYHGKHPKFGFSGPPSPEQFRLLEAEPPEAIARAAAIARLNLPAVVAIPGRAERVAVEVVSGEYADVLRLRPEAGRLLNPEDDRVGAAPVAVISDRLWREWFDRDREVAGLATLQLNGRPHTIVGVAPRGYRGAFGGTFGTAEVWLAAGAAGDLLPKPRPGGLPGAWLTVVRLRGDGIAAAEAAVHHLFAGMPGAIDPARTFVRLHPAERYFGTTQMTATGFAVIALSALLLAAACANLANMLFARGAQRAAEVAVRMSLGASRARIFSLFLIDSVVIAAAASVLGYGLAVLATLVLNAAFPSYTNGTFRVFVDLAPDFRVLFFALGCGFVAAVSVGVAAAWRAGSGPPLASLTASGAGAGTTRRGRTVRLVLVCVQVTTAVLLLMTAGLYLRSAERQLDRHVVFDTAPLATAVVDLRLHGYHEARGRDFFARALTEVRRLPGIEHAALADGFPGGAYLPARTILLVPARDVVTPEGGRERLRDPRIKVNAGYIGVSPGFLDTVGLPLRRGRDIAATDDHATDPVVVISEHATRLLWPNQDPIGKQVMFGDDGTWRTVVGVSGDPIEARDQSPLVSPANLVLIPAAQAYRPEMLVVVRSRTPAAQLEPLRRAIFAVDERVALFDVAAIEHSIMAWAAPLRAAATLTVSIGAISLAIAVFGIYGVIAFFVSQRTREFGIRLALGASPRQVVKLVVDDAVRLLLFGLLAGALVTSYAERYLQSQRVGFLPNEISTWALVFIAVLLSGLTAAYLPARRASRIDPNVALRDL